MISGTVAKTRKAVKCSLEAKVGRRKTLGLLQFRSLAGESKKIMNNRTKIYTKYKQTKTKPEEIWEFA